MNIPLFARSAALVALGAFASIAAIAEEADLESGQADIVQAENNVIEEVVVLGRLQSAAQSLLQDRIEDDALTDSLEAESISRMGDSTVAATLRRVSGLTLVNDKFVYVRGLGERYSSTSLNGAFVPSPDLTRNVVPLDLFPSAIVSSLAVQKTFSPDISANFGGGAVDIVTTPFPDKGTNFSFEIGSGMNTESDDRITYAGGQDDKWGTDDGTRAFPEALAAGLANFQGDLGVQNILGGLSASSGSPASLAAAEAANRDIMLSLNREIGLDLTKGSTPDRQVRAATGTTVDLSDDWIFGFQVGGAYDAKWRTTNRTSRNFGAPNEQFETEEESTHSVNVTGTFTTGFSFLSEHDVTLSTLYLRNTDDEAAISDFFNENRLFSEGSGFRNYRFEFEERALVVNQAKGSHVLGDGTKNLFNGLLDWAPYETTLDWFYSESRARSDIPNRISADYGTELNVQTAEVTGQVLRSDSSAIEYRFLDLDDLVTSYGWKADVPLQRDNIALHVKFGYQHDDKARTYSQREFGIGSLNASAAARTGSLDNVLADDNLLDPDNDFFLSVLGSTSRSYIAATIVDASYGMVDLTFNDRWRFVGGARYEDYRQVALPWNVFGYTVDQPQITTDPETLRNAVFQDDDYYPSAAIIYMGDLWAETFQLRLGYAETTIRPDLREVTDASYVDPITGELVNGNPNVRPSDVQSLDLRAEWFFANGNNLTVSLFRKEIGDPIEFFESPASDTNTAREIVNAEGTTIDGIEIDGVLALGILGGWGESFFLQGNVTVQDSETVAGVQADSPTNNVRPATGASDYVANLMLGFDSMDGQHSANILYNVFGERLYVAGRLGAPDGYEQPFHSLDINYSWYPNDNWIVKLKAQNLLDETIEIERAGVVTFSEQPGTSIALQVKYDF
jgi:TonB-dependent receptor